MKETSLVCDLMVFSKATSLHPKFPRFEWLHAKKKLKDCVCLFNVLESLHTSPFWQRTRKSPTRSLDLLSCNLRSWNGSECSQTVGLLELPFEIFLRTPRGCPLTLARFVILNCMAWCMVLVRQTCEQTR